jgi:drug/metabolite transporter (DMT)-like permease
MAPSAARHPLTAADAGLLLAANLMWGSTYVVGRDLLDTLPPLAVGWARFALGGLVLLLLGAHRTVPGAAPGKPMREDFLAVAVMGVVGFGGAKWLAYEGLALSTATDAALIINLEAVFTALLAAWLLRQALVSGQWIGVMVAFAGGVALAWPQGGSLAASGRALGNALLIGSVAAEALATVLGARATRCYSGLQITALGTYWGALCLAVPGIWQWAGAGDSAVRWLTPWTIGQLCYLAVFPTVVAYVVWFRVLGRVEAGRAAAFLYVQPVVGVLLGILLRSEWPGLLGWAGGGLVFAGVLLASSAAPARGKGLPPAREERA